MLVNIFSPRRTRRTHLSEYIVHGFTGLRIPLAEKTEKTQDLHLKERICDSGHVMFWAVPCCDERLQMADKKWNGLERRVSEDSFRSS